MSAGSWREVVHSIGSSPLPHADGDFEQVTGRSAVRIPSAGLDGKGRGQGSSVTGGRTQRRAPPSALRRSLSPSSSPLFVGRGCSAQRVRPSRASSPPCRRGDAAAHASRSCAHAATVSRAEPARRQLTLTSVPREPDFAGTPTTGADGVRVPLHRYSPGGAAIVVMNTHYDRTVAAGLVVRGRFSTIGRASRHRGIGARRCRIRASSMRSTGNFSSSPLSVVGNGFMRVNLVGDVTWNLLAQHAGCRAADDELSHAVGDDEQHQRLDLAVEPALRRPSRRPSHRWCTMKPCRPTPSTASTTG